MRTSGVLKVVIATCAISLIAAHLSPATAAAATQLVTCVDLASGKERISKTETCRTTEATAKWHLAPTDSALASGGTTKSLTICSNKESSPVIYQRIRTSCYKHMQTNLYTRSAALPAKPVITQVSSNSYESASLALASDPAANVDAPIAYYTITSSKGDVKKVNSWSPLTVTVSGLKSATSYTFTITATSVDGTSPISASSLPVTTQVYVAPVAAVAATVIAAPAFTLSASAETRTAKTTPIAGYTVTSTGGTITGYQISPSAPTGLSFSTTTGLLSGIPTETKTATTYTITGTNSVGSATATFMLRVTGDIGEVGPGGGKIFYVANSPFSCGPTRTATCSYLEAAPSGWNTGSDPSRTWAQSGQGGSPRYDTGTVNNAISPETATATAIGWGYRNTLAIILQGSTNTANSAAALADAYSVTVGGVVFDDWFLPSKDELEQIFIQRLTVGGLSFFYWSSSENDALQAWYWYSMGGFFNTSGYTGKNNQASVRPIRAF